MKSKYYSYIFIITIASTLLYVFSNNLPFGLGSYRYLWGPLSMILIVISGPRLLVIKPIRQLLIFGLVIVGILQYTLWSYMDDWNRLNILDDFYAIISISMVYFFLRLKKDSYTIASLGKWSLLFIIISLITTNIGLSINPMIIRDSAGFEFSGENKAIFEKLGSGGYSFMHLLVCIIPGLVYFLKYENTPFLNRKILIIILLAIFLTQLRGQIFANIIVTVLLLIFSFVDPKKRKKLLLVSGLVLIVFVILPVTALLSELLVQISSLFDIDSNLYYKLNDFADFLNNPELDESTGTGGRAERYLLLWDAFIKAPFFGHSSYNSSVDIAEGGHLFWMNRLALWGIFGFFSFVYVLYLIFKSIYLSFHLEFRFYYALSLLSFVILGLMKQITGREPWLVMIIIIPGLYYLQMRTNSNKTYTVKKSDYKSN